QPARSQIRSSVAEKEPTRRPRQLASAPGPHPSTSAPPPLRQGEYPIERRRERLLVARPERPRATRLHSRAAQRIHEVPQRQALSDVLPRVLLAARIDDLHVLGDEFGRQ